MVEWSITAVLKTVELKGSGGSNPSLSAKAGSRSRKRPAVFVSRVSNVPVQADSSVAGWAKSMDVYGGEHAGLAL